MGLEQVHALVVGAVEIECMRAVVDEVQAAEQQVRLQPVEQLAHRYQTLLRTQAETVMGAGSGDSGEGETSSSK